MVAVRSTSQSGASDSFGSSCTIPPPAGNVSGDIIVLLLEQWESGNPTVTWPSGFQASQLFEIVSGSQKFKGNWKRLTATESGNFVPSWTGSQWNMGHAICIQDALASGDPIDDVDTNTSTNSNEATITNTLTTVALQIHAIAKENAQLQSTTPTGFTEQRDGDYITTNTRVAPGSGSQSASGGVLAGSTLQLGVLIGIKPAAGGGATDLVIQDMSVAVTEDVPTLVPVFNLSVADVSIASTLDAVTIVKISDLAIADLSIATTEDNAVVNTATNLVIQDTTVATSVDVPTLTRIMDLAIQKMVVATRNDTPSFSQVHNIAIHDMFLYTATDLVNFAGGSGGGPVSIADVQAQKLPVLTGQTGSVQDLLKFYYGGLSGLAPATAFSISDHQKKYWETQTGLANRTMADLEKAFYDALLVPSGSLSDREFVYWTGL